MKKKVLLVLLFISISIIIVGCGKKRSYEELLDLFIKAYKEADVEITKEIFPPFYVEYSKNYMTKEYLENTLKKDKEEYGDDYSITYEITSKMELNDDELKALNNDIAKYFSTSEKASECYKYEGTMTYKGSKKGRSESISSIKYCKYDGKWYLVRN